jgi:hypothetical protein
VPQHRHDNSPYRARPRLTSLLFDDDRNDNMLTNGQNTSILTGTIKGEHDEPDQVVDRER